MMKITKIKKIGLYCLVVCFLFSACSTTQSNGMVEYEPVERSDWPVSSPQEEGLDPTLLDDLYQDASNHDTIESVLVIKNGKLIAERYFNEGAIDKKSLLQSVSKSYISALVGIALEKGCLESVDQKLLDFFPEYANQIQDTRKEQITIQHLLQMRSGYPWEETHPDLMAAMFAGDNPPLIAAFPLTADPGTTHQYSNTTSALLATIVTRACGSDLKVLSEEFLLDALDVEMGEFWPNKYDSYHPLYHLSARDAGKFGLVYLNDGEFNGQQIIPETWVRDSLTTYSENISTGGPNNGKIGKHFRDIGYGYQWWSARVGDHTFNFAYGHGGQLIILLDDLDMVIVTTADPFWMEHDGNSWKYEKSIINIIGAFIKTLPAE